MIREYYLAAGGAKRPYVNGLVELPAASMDRPLRVAFLIDTGADRSVLSARDLARAGITLAGAPLGVVTTGVGGPAATRTVAGIITLGSVTVRLPLLAFDLPAGVPSQGRPSTSDLPSLLGHDLLEHFILVLDSRGDRVLLLEPQDGGLSVGA